MKLICKTVFGSHLYGTSTPTSDMDVRGVYLPSRRDVLLGRIPRTNKEQPEGVNDDYELFSLHHFIKLAIEGQTLAFDMLWTPKSQVTLGGTYYDCIWNELYSLRHKFLSKHMNAFAGYARSQAAKYSLKGERLAKLESFLAILEPAYGGFLLADYFDQLPKDDERLSPSRFRELQIAGKWYGERTEVRYVRDSVQKVIQNYGKRAELAAQNQGVDWKAMSHAVRVATQLKELISIHEIRFPLWNAQYLLKIKLGQVPLVEVQNYLDDTLKTVQFMIDKSNLPEQVNRKFWDDWLEDTMDRYIRWPDGLSSENDE